MKTFLATVTGLSLALLLVTPAAGVLALVGAMAYLTIDLMERCDE